MQPQETDIFEGIQKAADAAMAQLAVANTDGLVVEFYWDAHQNDDKTKEAGRPIYENVECIQIRSPGESDIIRRVASAEDKRRFSKKYELFKQNDDQEKMDGFPLKMWTLVNEAQRRELAYFGIRTVEQLSKVSDVALQRVGPYLALRQQARDWLEASKEGAVLVKLRAENDDLRIRLKTLEATVKAQATDIQAAREGKEITVAPMGDDRVAALEAKLTALTERLTAAPLPKRRGRPPGSKNKPKTVEE